MVPRFHIKWWFNQFIFRQEPRKSLTHSVSQFGLWKLTFHMLVTRRCVSFSMIYPYIYRISWVCVMSFVYVGIFFSLSFEKKNHILYLIWILFSVYLFRLCVQAHISLSLSIFSFQSFRNEDSLVSPSPLTRSFIQVVHKYICFFFLQNNINVCV